MHPWTAGPTGEPFRLQPRSPQAVGLRGWWPMLDSRGASVLEDRWGYHRGSFGSGAAAPTWVNTPERGWVLDFASASSQYVDFGDQPLWDWQSESFSLSFWFCTTTTGTNYLIAKTDGSGAGWLVYMSSGVTAGRLRFWMKSTTSTERRTANAYNDGLWHHCLCSAEWTGGATYTLRIFVDGVQDDIASANGNAANLANSFALRLGTASNGTSPYQGKLGDFRIYSGALGLTEAVSLWAPQSRWDLYQLLRRSRQLPPGAAPSLLLSGLAAGTGGAVGGLLVRRWLAASSSGLGGASGLALVSRLLAQAAAGTAGANAALSVGRLLAAGVSGAALATAALHVSRVLAGTVNGTGATLGSAQVMRGLAGQGAGESGATGAFTLSRLLAATAPGAGALTGTAEIRRLLSGLGLGSGAAEGALTVLGATILLAGIATGSAAVSAALRIERRFAAELLAAAAVSGDLEVTRVLAAVAAGGAGASGALTGLVDALICYGGTAAWAVEYGGAADWATAYGGAADWAETYGAVMERCGDA